MTQGYIGKHGMARLIATGYYAAVIDEVLLWGAKQAVKYVYTNLVVKATRHGKSRSILLTIGKPNFQERKFVKLCKKAGEPFPVHKIQLKFPKGKK